MISSVRGTVLSVSGTAVVIEVAGIGYALQVTPQHALTLREGEQALIRTSLIVREDDLSLFGFAGPDELAVFDLLRGVTGVGPKSALGVLGAMTPAQIAVAVESDDDGAFRKVSGIGPKTAKLITVSLAGKMAAFAHAAPARGGAASTTSVPVAGQVLAALVGLGWAERLAAQALDEVVLSATDDQLASVPTLLRLALAQLGPQPAATR